MFSITDNERLRDAYALLMFMQRDISASAEKKAAVRLGAGSRIQWRSSEVIDMEEMLLSLNGPWSNAACIGYCVMAMRNAGLSEKTQRKVLDELTRCFDDMSVEDAAQMKF